jgi:hypothetical protein
MLDYIIPYHTTGHDRTYRFVLPPSNTYCDLHWPQILLPCGNANIHTDTTTILSPDTHLVIYALKQTWTF